jgi:hypothetical protein
MTSNKEIFYVKKVTGKYTCSISDLNGPVKKVKNKQKMVSNNKISIQNISIKEENCKINRIYKKSLNSDKNAQSFGSKGMSSDNSRNLSEMSLILTPMQVKMKQEKFSKSVNQLASIKSRFGSLKQTNMINNSILDEDAGEIKKTGFNRLMTGYSKNSKDIDNLTQKTDLSESAESFSKMFQGLKISLESEENLSVNMFEQNERKKSEIYSQKFQSGSHENLNCFLDLDVSDDNKYLNTPFMNKEDSLSKRERSSTQNQYKFWNLNKKSSKSGEGINMKNEIWTSAESGDINEMKGGFDLMKIIDNPVLYSSTTNNNPFENSTYQTSNLLVTLVKKKLIQRLSTLSRAIPKSLKRNRRNLYQVNQVISNYGIKPLVNIRSIKKIQKVELKDSHYMECHKCK